MRETVDDRTKIRLAVQSVLDLNNEVSTFSDDTSFFELGLDSLSMVELLSLVGRECGVRIAIRDLFEDATIDGFVKVVEAARHG